jgi:hypothetical protein
MSRRGRPGSAPFDLESGADTGPHVGAGRGA